MVEISVEVIGKPLMLRQELATGSLADGTDFKIMLALPPTCIVVEFPEGWYEVKLHSILEAAIAERAKASADE